MAVSQFTKYTGTVTGQAGSLITALDAALVTGQGWSKVFSGTNKAAYRAPSGNRLYLRVQDDGPGTGGAREARYTGYEAMSDVDTGVNPFPTSSQGVSSTAMQVIRKSNTADATARNYVIFADTRTIYMFVLTGDAVGVYFCWTWGEIYSYVTSDSWNTMIAGRTTENSSLQSAESVALSNASNTSIAGSVGGHFMARNYLGLPNNNGSIGFGVNVPANF